MLALIQQQLNLARANKKLMKGKEDLTIEHKFWSTQVKFFNIL